MIRSLLRDGGWSRPPPDDADTVVLSALLARGVAVITALALGMATVVMMASDPDPLRTVRPPELLGILVATGALLASVRVPWHERFRTRTARPAIRTGMLLVTVPVAYGLATRPAISATIVLLLAAPLFLSAVGLSLRDHVLLSTPTFLVVALAIVVGGPPAEDFAEISLVLLTTVVLGLAAGAAMAVRHELTRRSQATEHALRTVAEATPGLGSRAPDEIFRRVTDAAVALGYEVAGISVRQKDGGVTFASVRGVPAQDQIPEVGDMRGVAGQVWDRRQTVAVADYAALENPIDHWLERGIRCVIGTPVISDGRMVGALICGSYRARDDLATSANALEILASHAGRAHELAQRIARAEDDLDDLRTIDERRAALLTSVSHELRTPLSIVVGASGTLAAYGDRMTPEEIQILNARMNANASALMGIVDGLLDLARIDRGTLTAQLERVDLRDVLSQLTSRLGPLIDDRTVRVEVAPRSQVHADPRLIDRVVENLITNAVRHAGEGAALTLQVRGDGDRIEVAVIDDGEGMSPDRLADVREGPVVSDHVDGAGIGLALVREILALHDSELRITSRPGWGATFAFRLDRWTERPLPLDETAPAARDHGDGGGRDGGGHDGGGHDDDGGAGDDGDGVRQPAAPGTSGVPR